VLGALAAGLFLWNSPRATTVTQDTLQLVDRVPKFERFYRDATKRPLSESERWRLWKAEYDIAAVPPTPEGDALARRLLDKAWSQYPDLLPRVTTLTVDAESLARLDFAAINVLFASAEIPIRSKVVLYVGQFENNAYSIPAMHGELPTVVMPVENDNLRVAIAHELTHTINFQLAHVTNSFGGPVGETIFLEGLATRTSQHLVPGLPEARYVELSSEPGWLANCYAHRSAVLRGILPFLDQSGSALATRFTFGKGTTGMDREVYCAGWVAVGDMLARGKSFAYLARVPENKMRSAIRVEIEDLLNRQSRG